MAVAVVNVREVFVFMCDREVPVLRSGENGDRVGSMVGVVRVDRVCVLDDVMAVAVTVVAGGDDEDADE